jgi:hypothetical protein
MGSEPLKENNFETVALKRGMEKFIVLFWAAGESKRMY